MKITHFYFMKIFVKGINRQMHNWEKIFASYCNIFRDSHYIKHKKCLNVNSTQ